MPRRASVPTEPLADPLTLHEVGATLAGIASATELVRTAPGLGTEQAVRLLDMVGSEVRRLQRLVDRASRQVDLVEDLVGTGPRPALDVEADVDWDDATDRVDVVDLTTVLEPQVLRQVALGTPVSWVARPRRSVVGRADEIAEAVSILLANCARHAPGAQVRVDSRLTAGAVVLTVRDDGPGVDPEVAERLFDRGARGPASPGRGLGLHRARALAEHNGGELRLAAPAGPGASFELVLPSGRVATQRVDGLDQHLAHPEGDDSAAGTHPAG